MNTLNSMKKALRATGLYALTGETLADRELDAYAAGLDVLAEQIEALRAESFVPTADREGLMQREAQFGLSPAGKTVQERRDALLLYGAVTSNSNTPAFYDAFFTSLGLSMELVEDAEPRIYWNDRSEQGEPAERMARARRIQNFLPAHLPAILDFRTIFWNTIDRAERTFQEMDAAGMDWDAVDRYQGLLLKF
ncbi:hypothetical protein [Clostridium sp. D33t1_170424_F3]|uniref:hypothetical protein n=1 Tax=Clostridium sp. D33t1_170424_F3 TaxID=2787099 RepID=UPI0018AA72E3|nr:hypothetical protein [Clostridium sp. D33t1_170424_F3]